MMLRVIGINIVCFNFSGATAVDALSVGYRTILIDDCCRGTDFHDIEHTKEKVISNHGVIVHSSEVGFPLHSKRFPIQNLIIPCCLG